MTLLNVMSNASYVRWSSDTCNSKTVLLYNRKHNKLSCEDAFIDDGEWVNVGYLP